ncbi:MAG TPA: efflux RND transporter periplasmic adaptor subunit [Planctomycetaceae bacterium]|nr:efflux RND transporter periplasmic adaptor subunit [Planctomycetaceae bacterium]
MQTQRRSYLVPKWIFAGIVAAAGVAVSLQWRTEPAVHAESDAHSTPRSQPAPKSSENTRGHIRVEVTHPQSGGLPRSTRQPGSVHAYESADLYAKVSGYLKLQHVDIGDEVKEGQLLAEIDAPELVKAVHEAQANLDQAKAKVRQANSRAVTARSELEASQTMIAAYESELEGAHATQTFRDKQYNRMKNLHERKSVDASLVEEKHDELAAATAHVHSAEAKIRTGHAQVKAASARVEQADADVEAAEATLAVMEAALAKAKIMEQYTRIVSPYSGVVTKRSFFRGDFIRDAEGGAAQPMLTVERTDVLRVVVQVPDRDVPYTDKGDKAILEIDALPGEEFQGVVARTADSENHQTRTMRTELDIQNPKNVLREGMYGRVTLMLAPSASGVTVPSSCVVNDPKTEKSAVWVVRKDKAELVPVDVGVDNGVKAEVLKGLAVNDQVVVRYNGNIAPGAPVVVTSRPEKVADATK